ncbi:MAG: aldo/keto reductase [Lentisphaeria bacterium]|nr:aldo/keto reductase [Lentisphaeria bacterium]
MKTWSKRRLGRTDMMVSALSLGCASFGGSQHTDRDAVETVRTAIELGINFLDTSPLYGQSERRVGLALEGGWRERVYLETKVGTHPSRRGDYSAAATRWSVENSLRLLQTEYLDAVLIHDPGDIEVPLQPGHALDALLELKQRGVIGHIGLGVRQHAFHRRAIETGHCEIVLTYLDYTLLDQSVAGTTVPLALRQDVGIILGSVLAMKRLSGQEPVDSPRAHAMWAWCRERGFSVRDLALQFCLQAPFPCTVMPGPGDRPHLVEIWESAQRDIPADLWDDFRAEFGVGVGLRPAA